MSHLLLLYVLFARKTRRKKPSGFLSQKPGRSYTLLVLSQALTQYLAGVLIAVWAGAKIAERSQQWSAVSLTRCITKERLHCTKRNAVTLCFFLLIGHTSSFFNKSFNFRCCCWPCDVKASADPIECAIKCFSLRITLKIFFCTHQPHPTSSKSQRCSLLPHQRVHNAVLHQSLAGGKLHNHEHNAQPACLPHGFFFRLYRVRLFHAHDFHTDILTAVCFYNKWYKLCHTDLFSR